ncbi:MAG TPA: PaaI family thioesterase [Alphaproteobacteria bacterium]|nr:PaaI family thioesterase [Alphaproteobacteria bacterium]
MPRHKPAHGHVIHSKLKAPKNTCFGCGPENPDGMKLKFYFDEQARQVFCNFKLAKHYQGPPGHAHGGVIATILDEAMGKVNKFRNVVALTKTMDIEYFKPVPLGKQLTTTAHELKVEGRKHTNVAEIVNKKGEVLARSSGTFIAIDPEKMFARFIKAQD